MEDSSYNSRAIIGLGLISKLTSLSLIPRSKTSFLKTVFIYLFFPILFPVVIYKIVRRFRERFGLSQRPLEGKVVLVTGGSSGIGEALAHRLYLSGCKLILTSRRAKELERVKREIVKTQTYGPVYIPATLQLDLEDLASIQEKSEAALAIYGYIDILINNAGISYRGNALNTSVELDQKIMIINYFGPVALTKILAKSMVERGTGQIVFMSSVQGKIAIPNRSAYAASKHATQALADCLRAELSSTGIGVTVICPGYVQTNLSRNALTDKGVCYGKVDATTANGISAACVADRTVQALLNNEKEVTITSLIPSLAIFIRNTAPTLFFRLMSSRARAES